MSLQQTPPDGPTPQLSDKPYAIRFIKQVIQSTVHVSITQQVFMGSAAAIITLVVQIQQGLIPAGSIGIYVRAALWVLALTYGSIIVLNIIRAPFILDREQRKRIEGLQAKLVVAERRTLRVSTVPTARQLPEADEPQTPQAEPNLVCNAASIPAHENYCQLNEGYEKPSVYGGGADAIVLAARICNEFDPTRKVGVLSDVSAQIFYTSPEGHTLTVHRGSWLSDNQYRVDFPVNREQTLIIAGKTKNPRTREHDRHVFYLTREVRNSDKKLEDRIRFLEGTFYSVKVRLISETEGIVHAEYNFNLTITYKPEWGAELKRTDLLSPKEIRGQLEAYLREGSDILKGFPRDWQYTAADAEKVDGWETRVVGFINDYPDKLSTSLFLSDYPEAKITGAAHSSNWPYLKRMATRLDRLKEFIDDLRRD